MDLGAHHLRFSFRLAEMVPAFSQVSLLCALKTGSFCDRVFGLKFPWLGEEVWDEGIEVYGRAEGVRD